MTQELDELATAFKVYMEQERVPANTMKARLRTLRSVGCPGTVSREGLEIWWRARAHLSPATRSNDLANLRTFYKWCRIWEHRDDDPTMRIESPKVPNGLPRPIGRSDLHQVLDHVDDELRRAVCLGAYGGLRIEEAADLDWPEIDVEARTARVTGKGRKVRLVKVSMVLIDQLLPDTGYNVVTGTEKKYTANTLQRRVNRAIRAAGVDATFHQCRHRYGTLGYRATGDLIALGKQMGHSSPMTTAGYAAASDEAADRIAEAVIR